MTTIVTKLTLTIEGPSMSECEDKVMEWAGMRLQARILGQPQKAIEAQTTPNGLKLTVQETDPK